MPETGVGVIKGKLLSSQVEQEALRLYRQPKKSCLRSLHEQILLQLSTRGRRAGFPSAAQQTAAGETWARSAMKLSCTGSRGQPSNT